MDDHKQIIRRNLVFLCDKISNTDLVFRNCLAQEIIAQEEFENFEHRTPRKKIEHLCLLVGAKSPQDFVKFVAILRRTGNIEAADAIDQSPQNGSPGHSNANANLSSNSVVAANINRPTVVSNDVAKILKTDPILCGKWSSFYHSLGLLYTECVNLDRAVKNGTADWEDHFRQIVVKWLSKNEDPNERTVGKLCVVLRKGEFNFVAGKLEEQFGADAILIF